MAFARRFESAGEIGESRMIDFKRNSRNATRRITERHLARVTQ